MKDQRTAEHDGDSQRHGEFQGFLDTVASARAIVVSQHRDQAVVETEDRHEEKALEFEINAEDCRCRLGESTQDLVHRIGHDRSDRHHQDRRSRHKVDLFDDFPGRAPDL